MLRLLRLIFKPFLLIFREIFVMRGRERLVATAAIWIAFAIVMNNIVDRFTRVVAEFTGLWPNMSFYGMQAPSTDADWDRLSQAMDSANQISQSLMNQVNESISAQMTSNMPILVILALALILAATLSTYFIWSKAHLEPEAAAPSRRGSSMKAKHGSRVQQVVNALDEDELDELRARLWEAEQADAVPLEELLAERNSHRR
jgi:predicted PurR-regulated permease PerM